MQQVLNISEIQTLKNLTKEILIKGKVLLPSLNFGNSWVLIKVHSNAALVPAGWWMEAAPTSEMQLPPSYDKSE